MDDATECGWLCSKKRVRHESSIGLRLRANGGKIWAGLSPRFGLQAHVQPQIKSSQLYRGLDGWRSDAHPYVRIPICRLKTGHGARVTFEITVPAGVQGLQRS